MQDLEGFAPPSFWNLADGFPAYMQAYTHAPQPVPTAVPELDEMLRGGFRPGIHFIGGNTGAGKSAFCLWLMERIASLTDPDTGEPYGVTYVSLELSGWEVRARLGSRLSAHMDELEMFEWADFERLGAEARAAIEAGTYDPAHDPVYLADMHLTVNCPNVRIIDAVSDGGVSDLTRICMEITECGAHGGRVCFVDYLQCIDAPPGVDETEALKEDVRALNLAGIRAGVAVIAIAAVNRAKGAEMRRGSKDSGNPGADIFRGSSWIEYTGLSCFALVRRDDARSVGDFVEVELWPVKNRRGTCDEPVALAYDGRHGEFSFGGD